MIENVLVIPKSIFNWKNGFQKADKNAMEMIIKSHGLFMERNKAENNFEFFQIIPYVIIRKDDKVFYTKRLKKQAETRLHEKLSIGVGGHINDTESNMDDMIIKGLYRELREELYPFKHSDPVFLGTLLDVTNEVGNVHLGLVFYIDAYEDVNIKEINKMSGSFTDLDFLKTKEVFKKLESWSQILVENYRLTYEYER